MIKFVLGGSGCGKTSHLLEDMKRTSEERLISDKGLLCYLVPEQFSLHSEKLLLSDKEAVTDIQVLSFNRLAYRLFASIGGPPGKLVGEIGKQMLVRKVLADLEGELVFYKSAISKPGFVSEVAALLEGLGEFKVTASELRTRAKDSSPHFRAKLNDTALILETFKNETRENYLIGDEIPELLCKKLENYVNRPLPLLDGACFWLDGFSGFTLWELQIIREIMKRAKKMVVSFTVNNNITTQQQDVIEKISQNEKNVETIHLKRNNTVKSGELHELRQFFEHEHFETFRERYKDIHIMEAAEPYGECLAAAEVVLALHSEHGYRFSDIAIVTDNKNLYEKNLVSIFSRLNIPLFVDSEESILTHPLIEYVLSALDLVLYGRRYEDVFRFLKTGLSPLHEDDVLHLENYVLANGISSYRFQYEFKAKQAESARNAFIAALQPIWNLAPKKNDLVINFASQVFQMLENSRVQEKLTILANNALLSGKPADARLHTQVWQGFCDVFDKYVEILGERKVSLKTFSDSLKAAFAKTRPGRLPPTSNQVILGDTSRSRYPDVKAMIVLGANDGSLVAPTGLFSENEKRILKNSGLEIAKDRTWKAYEQDYNIYRTLTKPSEKLYIFYPKTNGEGKEAKPARLFKKIQESLKGLRTKKAHEYTEFGVKTAPPQTYSLSRAREKLLAGNVFSSSISRLESYARCPYMYFLRYVLGAKEREVYEILPRDLGKYFHDAIAGFTKQIMESNQLPSPGEIEVLTRRLIDESIKNSALVMDSARNRHIAKMLAGTANASCNALVSHLRLGKFSPHGVEEGIDMAIPLEDGNLLRIYGRIDRVDINAEGFVKVIDYKSSETGFSLSDVASGLSLQLMLYLRSTSTGGKKPGGAFYFTVQNPILHTDNALEGEALQEGLLKCFRMNGVLSESLVHEIDQSIAGGESAVIPVRLKKDGGFWKNNSLLERTQMDALLLEAENAAKKTTGRIFSGNMKPEPYKTKKLDPCRFCEYILTCNIPS